VTAATKLLATLARLPPRQDRQVVVQRDLGAKMADGVLLLADRYVGASRAGDTSPPPVVLMRSPYGRRQMGVVGRVFAERGYQVVIQSCRGTFGSGGEWEPFRHEREDGRYTLAWLAEQEWFGGSVFTFGPSYLGLVQWAMCGDANGYVKAMAPAVTSAFFRESAIYPGDALALETMLNWVYLVQHQESGLLGLLRSRARQRAVLARGFATVPLSAADRGVVGQTVRCYQDWLAHEERGDPWWDPIDFRAARPQAPPTTHLGGWYDIFLPAQIEDFVAARSAGRTVRMTIGPWTHAGLRWLPTSVRESLAWFDEHSAGGATPDPAAAIRMFVMGSRRWVNVPDWPPPATTGHWYLRSQGGLAPSPAVDSAPDRFRFDPADPTPGIGGPSLDNRNAGRKDQRRREERSDVLTYTSERMERATTVAGPVAVDLWFRSSLEHNDISVRLCVVSTKGRSYNLSDGYRRLHPEDVSADADGTRHVRIDMWPTAVTFRSGERIRLQVASAAHPLFNRNLGGGEPIATATTMRAADLEVFHDAGHPSALELPISPI
jgi:putative CocE/NonD family hydrolase